EVLEVMVLAEEAGEVRRQGIDEGLLVIRGTLPLEEIEVRVEAGDPESAQDLRQPRDDERPLGVRKRNSGLGIDPCLDPGELAVAERKLAVDQASPPVGADLRLGRSSALAASLPTAPT